MASSKPSAGPPQGRLAPARREGAQRQGCPDLPAAVMRLAPQDNVAVALRALAAGEVVVLGDARIRVARAIALGHKLAAQPIAAGEKIVKYNCPIGSARGPIAPGDYVHTHNVASDYLPTYTLPE